VSQAGSGLRSHALEALDAPIRTVRQVSLARADGFARLGITTVRDLLEHLPHRYIDFRQLCLVKELQSGVEATVLGTVMEIHIKTPRPKLSILEVAISDDAGGVLVGVWYNQDYMKDHFTPGDRVAFAGIPKFEFGMMQIRRPFVEKLDSEYDALSLNRIFPVHRCTEGLTTNWIRKIVSNALSEGIYVPDYLPARIRIARQLMSRGQVFQSAHFPQDQEALLGAKRRFVYDELLCLQLGLAMRRHRLGHNRVGYSHTIDGPSVRRLPDLLPFALTSGQKEATGEILADMADAKPMNRMLVGDVGTGKTLVAAQALAAAVDSGKQAAIMAPTEVLANQYRISLGHLFDQLGIEWALLTGSTPKAQKEEVLQKVADGRIDVLLGTHSVIGPGVKFCDLTLAIVDEQHRFGVNQRLGLRNKGAAVDLLVMSATPIPRSLALTFYGDLAVSYLKERPGNRGDLHVKTECIPKSRRNQAYKAIRQAVAQGRQAYIICPLVEEQAKSDSRSALKEVQRLKANVFPDLRLGILTGRMRPAEKSDVMERFRAGAIDVLVATTVVEVGVDVPNATVMIVEDAERFGLAQLHQLRGRIGRGEHPGLFFAFADPKTSAGRARMKALESSTDGFFLAQKDLEVRGHGHLFGERQSGLPELRFASLTDDADLVEIARSDTLSIIQEDPELMDPVHRPLGAEVKQRFGSAWKWVSSG